jgi:hypothetical protein
MHYWRLTNFIVYLWLTIEYDLCQILQVGLITDTKKKSWENTKDQIELCHDLGTDTKEKSWENTKGQIELCLGLVIDTKGKAWENTKDQIKMCIGLATDTVKILREY